MSKYKERPCPGCGKVDERPPQKLCRDCVRQLALGRKREKEIALLESSGEKVRVAIDTNFAYSPATRKGVIGFLKVSHCDLVDALIRLGGLEECNSGTSESARAIYFTYSIPYHTRPRRYVWATDAQADDVELVLSYIQEVCEAWYEEGFQAGRDIIRRLGTAGLAELNALAIK